MREAILSNLEGLRLASTSMERDQFVAVIMEQVDALRTRAEKAEAKVVELKEELDDTTAAGLKDANLAAHLYLENKKLESSLAALREQTRWIPVEERLPENNIEIRGAFVRYGKKETTKCFFTDKEIKQFENFSIPANSFYEMKEDQFSVFKQVVYGVTHWRPIDLPDADKESEE